MEYLVVGNGTMPEPEMRAAFEEMIRTDDDMSVNVREDDMQTEWYGALSRTTTAFNIPVYVYEPDEVVVRRVLLMDSDDNSDDLFDFIGSLAPPAKVFVLNQQMLEIVPPEGEPSVMEEHPSDADIQEDEAEAEAMTVVGDDEVLDEMDLGELKRVAEGLGVTPSDWRSKDALRKAIRGASESPVELKVGSAKAAELADKNDATEVQSTGNTAYVHGTVHLNKNKAAQEKLPSDVQSDIVLLLLSAATSLTKAAALLDDS